MKSEWSSLQKRNLKRRNYKEENINCSEQESNLHPTIESYALPLSFWDVRQNAILSKIPKPKVEATYKRKKIQSKEPTKKRIPSPVVETKGPTKKEFQVQSRDEGTYKKKKFQVR